MRYGGSEGLQMRPKESAWYISMGQYLWSELELVTIQRHAVNVSLPFCVLDG